MLKKIIFLFFFISNLLFAEDFITLKNKLPNAQNSLIEVFSYKCIHCYNHFKFKSLERLKHKNPALRYEIYPASLADAKYGNKLNEFFAYAIYKDRQNSKDSADEDSLTHRLALTYFKHFFVENEAGVVVSTKEFSDEKSFLNLGFNALEIDKTKLEEFLIGNEAKELLENFQWANEVAKNFGTPAFVINGKYQINPEAITSLENLEKIIKELSQH